MEVLKDDVKLVVKDLYKKYAKEDVLKKISFDYYNKLYILLLIL